MERERELSLIFAYSVKNKNKTLFIYNKDGLNSKERNGNKINKSYICNYYARPLELFPLAGKVFFLVFFFSSDISSFVYFFSIFECIKKEYGCHKIIE